MNPFIFDFILLFFAAVAQGEAPQGVLQRCQSSLGFTRAECQVWEQTVQREVPPVQDADQIARALFGQKLFFDPGLSPAGVQCVSCHIPEKGYSDGRAVSKGIRAVTRNSPSLLNVGYYGEFFWDGRAQALWEQPLITLLHPDEMAADPLGVAHFLWTHLRGDYEKIFGPMPPLSERNRFPEQGVPGQKAFDQMTLADQDAVLKVFRNVGHAFAAYVQRLGAGPARIDRYLLGEISELSPAERRGMQVITRVGCLSCHSGVGYTDQQYHALGVSPQSGDLGRAAGLAQRQSPLYRALRGYRQSPRSAPSKDDVTPADWIAQMQGAFRTPSLRNLMRAGPYFHDGSAASIGEVLDHHARVASPPYSLSAKEKQDIEVFLRSLEGRTPSRPWVGWPYR